MFEITGAPDLDAACFSRVARLAYDMAGISLNQSKQKLVQMRLATRVRALGLQSYPEYLDRVERGDADELWRMIDVLTTNKTSFFREAHHFEFLRSWLRTFDAKRPIRGWSAGCSTGEEPYTLAMVLNEELKDIDRRNVRLLATDISDRVLKRAREGRYDADTVASIPQGLCPRYFNKTPDGRFEAGPRLRKLISFAHLNLMEPWPMKGPFDFIFCRNVMIYFDKPTRTGICDRYHELLNPGGHLFLGHAESLLAGGSQFGYVQPAVYRK